MCERSASPHHLLLDTRASSTTNVKMKKLHIIAGLLVIGLLAQSGLAKTKSRNGRTQRQAYLPPRAQSGPTITEEYITIHEGGAGGQSPFQESNYGDGKYQIFEIHSHYEPSGASGGSHTNYNAPGYLPPQQEIRVEHVHQAPSVNNNRLNLGSNGARGGVQQAVPISAPVPVAPAVPVPFPSSYQHDFPSSQSESVSSGGDADFAAPAPIAQEEIIRVEHFHVSQLQNSGQKSGFKAPDYLPPHGGSAGSLHSQAQVPLPTSGYRAPDYLPPHQEQHHAQQQHSQALPLHQHHTQSRPIAIQSVSHQQHSNSFVQHQPKTPSKGPEYLPPHSEHQHSHQNIQFPGPQSNQFKGPDYLPPHQGHQQGIAHQQIEQHQKVSHSSQFKGPDYLPPHQDHHNPQYNVQHPGHQQGIVHQQIEQHQHVSQQVSHSSQFKGPDYLPPHEGQHSSHHHVQPQEHHHGQQHHHEVNQPVPQPQTAYKGPDYLPPHQGQQVHQQDLQVEVQHESNSYKGPDYLPPHQTPHNHYHVAPQQVQQHQSTFKGPDYLPPHHEQQSHHQVVQQQFSQQPNSYKGPDYLPPHQAEHVHTKEAHQQIQHQQTSFKGPDYLPPHQGQHTPQPQTQHYTQQHQTQHHTQQHHVQQHSTSFRAPDYLPPHQDQHVSHHATQHQTHSGGSTSQPGSLPAGYEPQIPAVPVAPALPSQPAFQHPLPQPAPQYQHETTSFKASSSLPQGYDFEKPPNAEQAIAELHTLPEEQPLQQEVVVQSQIQVAQGQQQADIIYGSQQSGVNYQANGYLPPHQSTNNYQSQQPNVQVASSAVGVQQNVQQYQQGLQQVAPQTFTPTPSSPAAPVAQAPVSNYLPPATPVQAQHYNSNLRSLSSYMTNIQPFQRYASAPRQPFREYGPPPAAPAPHHTAIAQQHQQQQQHHQQPQPLPVAPMYREQASRPPHYAPAMSYATNAVANSYAVHHTASQQQQQHVNFNQQTRQNLQQFMPIDVRQPSSAPASVPVPVSQPAAVHSAPAVPARQSTSSKIRTVQILNPAAVKTLKVLETSDHTGVKTIKILGHSNTQPTGDHHIVKVVTQNSPNAHEHVQTVKIFNDHEEVPSHASAGGNAYLPPSVRVARQTPLKLQLLSNEKNRRPFTGRRRYRF